MSKGLKQEISDLIEGLEKKKKELADERLQYKEGCPYEIYLGGAIQGLHYALNYPFGIMTMRSLESDSREKDRKEE